MRGLLLFFFLLPNVLFAQGYPDHRSRYVNDFANLIDQETEARIESLLIEVKNQRGVEMTVVTIDSRNDYGTFDAIEPFATGLFNSWGIGNPKRNDGILILIAQQDRDMRIELGAGYPPAFDDTVQTVIESYFLPWFRQGDYASGIEAGVRETIKRTRLEFTDDGYTTGSRIRLMAESFVRSIFSGGFFSWVFGALGLAGGGVIAYFVRQYQRNRPRRCDLCDRPMQRLPEETDDNYLSHGQKVEESLKSKDYDVWFCQHDDHVMIEGYRNWFSAFGACPICAFRTLHSKRTVLSSATTSHSGSARVNYNCRNCDHSYTETVVLAKLSESSSSSSGGSFGGGSSSGGGASGSW